MIGRRQPVVRANDWRVLQVPALGSWDPNLTVSVVIPAHDAVHLPKVLAGLAAQTYPPHLLEVVVVDAGGRYSVTVAFSVAASNRLTEATKIHLGRPIAILLDGKVVSAPTLRSMVRGSAVISGDFTRAEAERIASALARRGAASDPGPVTAAPAAQHPFNPEGAIRAAAPRRRRPRDRLLPPAKTRAPRAPRCRARRP